MLHGSRKPAIVAAGHSHVLALLIAAKAGRGPAGHEVAVAYTAKGWAPPLDPSYWDFVAENADGRTIVIAWNGNEHLGGFLISPTPAIHLFDPTLPAMPPDSGMWIPREMFRQHWDCTYDGLTEALNRLVPRTNVIVLGTPPPKPDILVRAALSHEQFFVDHARSMGCDVDDIPLTAEQDRLAMWRLLQDMLKERVAASGAAFMPVPAMTIDPDGFLREEYSAPDVTHANEDFGALLWSEIAQRLLIGANA